ncbi:hypothetical protein FSP39_013163 [Pinctada imbricata]|uniref:Integrase catalytic domain-containing protein n=1 Tax=Pinctada imbricata TaxID=66713 RepID=A0AA88XRB2_PINIB|nr:hypothetical protein FSP39_013163 [Pinctada imbricata]
MDLLAKWLGPESSKYAVSIRAANSSFPHRGVARLWERLEERYGSPELVEASLKAKLESLPKLRPEDNKMLYDLSDIVAEIIGCKENPKYATLLSYFDSSSGIIPIINKLPRNLQEKWTTQASNYKKKHQTAYPPLSFLGEFLQEMSRIRNDPGFQYESRQPRIQKGPCDAKQRIQHIGANKTDTKPQDLPVKCTIHVNGGNTHLLKDCRTFKSKKLADKKKILKDNKVCFRCCNSHHMARDCKVEIKCDSCDSKDHVAALHSDPQKEQGGEREGVKTNCLQICGDHFGGKSCAKTVLVRIYPQGEREKALDAYAIIDDQSNRSLAKSEFFNLMNIDSDPFPYIITSCAGSVTAYGRKAEGFVIESWDATETLKLPVLTECDNVPSVREEIPTPEIAKHFSHLMDIAAFIPPLQEHVPVLLLLGRDVLEAHYVLDQRIGDRSPYAQKLKLGWVLIGEACLNRVHTPDSIRVNKVSLTKDGRASVFPPCTNNFKVRDIRTNDVNDVNDKLFVRTPNDDKSALSQEDKDFLKIMDGKFHRNEAGSWVAPLPFRSSRRTLPNNHEVALRRATILERSLQKDSVKRKHFFTFMEGILSKHAELAPTLKTNEEHWYLPIFGVYHPKKPTKLRVVFDSSAKFNDVSLNDILLCGPDLTNNLMGVLLRFRKGQIAITADIEQMFFGFIVSEEHRNFLRFLWHRNNDPTMELVEYRMLKHVFGNSPSPAVATYGLRKAIDILPNVREDVKYFVNNNFYVDDALLSTSTPQQAVDIMKRTQEALQKGGNLRLHKIASNSLEVVNSFAAADRSTDLENIDFGDMEDVPLQRSLGLFWNLQTDSFTFKVNSDDKPFTKRGVLSTLHSVFDPLGFAAPFILLGRMIFRELIDELACGWDDLLPPEYYQRWNDWRSSLSDLPTLSVPRPYVSTDLDKAVRKELHVYADASERAVSAVAYLFVYTSDDDHDISFIFGKSKLAPKHGHTIPRLELCSAVLASEIAATITEQLHLSLDDIRFHTDSKVVLGYLYNRTRRFYTYVANRVDKILSVSSINQWSHVSSESNPADVGSRGILAKDLQSSAWLNPPKPKLRASTPEAFELQNPDKDKEIRPIVNVCKTNTKEQIGICKDFERFSSWKRLISVFTILRECAINKQLKLHESAKTAAARISTEKFILREVQQEAFQKEIHCLTEKQRLPGDSPLASLNPFLDEDGLIRVGGRLTRASMDEPSKHPIVIPKKAHIATLLVRYFHEQVHHQGRHITEGSVRSGGFWIIAGKRLISSILHSCVTCRKLRGKQENQIMADLPSCRLHPTPPFSFVGVDTFGHWHVVSRRTRGGIAQSKRWAILFTCLTIRAVHIEIVEEMTASSFINALRRFVSVRGKVREYHSDRGTNFIGSTDSLRVDAINIDDPTVKHFLLDNDSCWKFNPPHASHFGGVWERMIGVARRILESLFLENHTKSLTHEVLVTFMAEVCAIINHRPIVPVSSDPEDPQILSPSNLLTHKEGGDVAPFEEIDPREIYKSQWKHVQVLADKFWRRWQNEFLQSLQTRRKWKDENDNLSVGDVVLLKEKDAKRNAWPTAIIEEVFPSADGKVRKVNVRTVKDNIPVVYSRPITELVLLHSPSNYSVVT